MSVDLDLIVTEFLSAIYKKNLFQKTLALKGGQAIRFAENIKERQSADIDLSAIEEINDYENFFSEMESAITQDFKKLDLNVIDFKFLKQPKTKRSGMPDFWSGWSVEFKLLETKHLDAPKNRHGSLAIIPDGLISPKIEIDISEYEYCGSIETVKVKSSNVTVYSRVLIILEKLRSLCQQHPKYKYFTKTKPRSRDFYDIDLLYSKSIEEDKIDNLISECKIHIGEVFKAKGVDLNLLVEIFDEEYLSLLEASWEAVKKTVDAETEGFDYYVESVKFLVEKLK